MRAVTSRNESRGHLWRSRWAAIGAAVAVTFGAGGLVAVNAAGGVDSTTVLTDPVRVLDSRDPVNVGLNGPFASQAPQKLKITGSIPTTTGTRTVVPVGATGVLLNVTAVAPSAAGFISIRPGDATGLPSTSSLNFTAGQIVPNAVLVALPTGGANAGQIDITYDAFGASGPTTDILIDVVGYTNNSTLAALQTQVDGVEAANAAQQTQIDSLLPPAGPGVLQLPASSFQPSVVSDGNSNYYEWRPSYNGWGIRYSAPTNLCYFTEAELPQDASFDLMKANYATDGSPGGTVTLYRSNGGFGSDPAVSVAALNLPAPVPTGIRQAETGSFNEPAVIAGDVYLVVVCQSLFAAFSDVEIEYTVPA